MTGIRIDLEISDGEAREGLAALLQRMDRKQPFFKSVGERLLSSASDRFRSETDPQGRPWVSLKPATIRARERDGQTPITILRSNRKGKSASSLAGSINYEATEDGVEIGSPVVYAAIHQLGGTIQRPERQAKVYMAGRRFVKKTQANQDRDVTIPAHSITIPARPYLGLSRDDETGIREDAEDWLTR